MDMIDRYLAAVSAQLPQDQREDIVAELRDLILSRFEAREEELGRPLADDEQEEILREIGHPLVVAARYRKGPDSLVGPELFPYWLFAVKAGLLLVLAVQAVGLFIHLVSGPADAGQAISQALHGFIGGGLTLVGLATAVAAGLEHYNIRPRWMTHWRVKDLGAFGLSDPAAWGAAAAGKPQAKAVWTPKPAAAHWPGGDHLFSLLVTGVFVLWWVGVLQFPGLMNIELRGADAVVRGAPVWTALHGFILVYALGHMAVDLAGLARPTAVRLRGAGRAALAVAGLWLTWAIFEAGHWFTLQRGDETARIAGDGSMLNLDTLRALGDSGRELSGVADNLSIVAVWVLAMMALGLVFQLLGGLWRLARG